MLSTQPSGWRSSFLLSASLLLLSRWDFSKIVCNALLVGTTFSPKASSISLSYSNSNSFVQTGPEARRINWWEIQNMLLLERSDDYLTMKPNFQSLLPKPWITTATNIDVTLEFSDPKEGSKHLIKKCGLDDSIEPFFQQSMSYFQQLCVDMMLSSTPLPKIKVRIVGTRGSPGTKCPRWHVDYVPVRWIQSLVGPGCDYVVDEGVVNRNALNALDLIDEQSIEAINNQIVRHSPEAIHQAPEGQAVILLGCSSNTPCVHKSPNLNLFQGRVLMTMDIVLPDDNWDEEEMI